MLKNKTTDNRQQTTDNRQQTTLLIHYYDPLFYHIIILFSIVNKFFQIPNFPSKINNNALKNIISCISVTVSFISSKNNLNNNIYKFF